MKEEKRGKPNICKVCGYRFRFTNECEKEIWKLNGYLCPSCKTKYSIFQDTERKLFEIQDKYFMNKDSNILGEMYGILYPYVRSIFLKNFTKFIRDSNEISYHTHCACSKIVERYLSDSSFSINVSFSSYAVLKIKESIWNKKENFINIESYDCLVDNKKIKDNRISKVFKNKSESYDSEIMRFIDLLNKELSLFEDIYVRIRLLVYFILYVSGGGTKIDEFTNNYGSDHYDKFVMLFSKLKNMLYK